MALAAGTLPFEWLPEELKLNVRTICLHISNRRARSLSVDGRSQSAQFRDIADFTQFLFWIAIAAKVSCATGAGISFLLLSGREKREIRQ